MVGFKDRRLQERLGELSRRLGEAPSWSFPQVFQDPASLEACYRFFSNVKVTPDAILHEHYEEVATRVRSEEEVIVLHDTTHFFYGVDSNRRGLGRMRKSNNTFFAHVSLVLSGSGYRRPLGVAALQTYVRNEEMSNEFVRWGNGVHLTRSRIGKASAIHVMDREADDYTLLCQLIEGKERFVIRARIDRILDDETRSRLSDAVRTVVRQLERDVNLSKRTDGERPPASKKKHPVREARETRVAIGASTIHLKRPSGVSKSAAAYGARPAALEVNVVRVWEPAPPDGEAPVEWLLLTSEPIDTPDALERVVDLYRTRWTIEEYFKAIKTGCSMEKRQLLDYDSLCNALAIFVPIACKALAVRSAAHDPPPATAIGALDEDEMRILRLKKPKYLSTEATPQEVLLAVASLGGHIKWNGSPGWLTLLRGMQQLTVLVQGWRLAKLQYSYDQS